MYTEEMEKEAAYQFGMQDNQTANNRNAVIFPATVEQLVKGNLPDTRVAFRSYHRRSGVAAERTSLRWADRSKTDSSGFQIGN